MPDPTRPSDFEASEHAPGEDAALRALAARLDRLRRDRAVRRPEVVLMPAIRAEQAGMRKAARRVGSTVEAWRAVAPASLRDAVRVLGWRRGRLELGVGSPGARHELEQWLRADGARRLGAELGRAIPEVRVVVGAEPRPQA